MGIALICSRTDLFAPIDSIPVDFLSYLISVSFCVIVRVFSIFAKTIIIFYFTFDKSFFRFLMIRFFCATPHLTLKQEWERAQPAGLKLRVDSRLLIILDVNEISFGQIPSPNFMLSVVEFPQGFLVLQINLVRLLSHPRELDQELGFLPT